MVSGGLFIYYGVKETALICNEVEISVRFVGNKALAEYPAATLIHFFMGFILLMAAGGAFLRTKEDWRKKGR